MTKKATTIIASLCIAVTVCAAAFGGYTVGRRGEPDAQPVLASTSPTEGEGVVVGGVGSISIPGFDRMSFKAGQTKQAVTLYNPEANNCAFVVSITLPSGNEIYRSEKLGPGKTVEQIEISDPLNAGIYEASTLRYSCYTLDEDPQELNGADSTFTLEVLP